MEDDLPTIQNVVATTEIKLKDEDLQQIDKNKKEKINLTIISQKCMNVTYNKKRFPAVVMRKQQPCKGTGLIFGSGKIIIIGTKSESDSKKVAEHICKDICKALGIPPKDNKIGEIQIRNIVAKSTMNFQIDLIGLSDHYEHSKFATKDESFPGCIYRLKTIGIVALIFTSGKIVFTGAKDFKKIVEAQKQLKQFLFLFKKKQQ